MKAVRAIGVLATASVSTVAVACLFGPLDIPAAEVLRHALGLGLGPGLGEAGTAQAVVVDMRLSRALLAWLCGAGLGLSGAVFQGLLRNPLADPFTLGVSSGGAFAASLAIYAGLSGTMLGGGLSLLPLAALAGSLAALALVAALASGLTRGMAQGVGGSMGGGFSRETLVLAGIVVATFLAACISLIKSLGEESVGAIVFWIMGSFQGRGWAHVGLYAAYALPGALACLRYGRELDILALGGAQATQLGVNAGRVRLALLCAASLVAGAGVAVAGVVGFVGLVAPHGARLLVGSGHRVVLPLSALLGGALLTLADLGARTLLAGGAELPVGVVTALGGAPVFCFLLARRGRFVGGGAS